MPGSVVVVTDSTATLPADVVERLGIEVVPLQVVIGAAAHDEGTAEATPAKVADALRAFRPVSTSRPAPAVLLEAYERLARRGAKQIVSVHLSAEMSGTVESARLAGRDATVRVVCVDTRQVGVAVGYAAVAAAEVAARGGSVEEAAAAAEHRAARAESFFYVDTLEHLRRGGRIGAAAALVGSALAVKPLLKIEDGVVASLERVRTSGKAIARLADLAVAAAGEAGAGAGGAGDSGAEDGGAGDREVDVAVAHLANPDRAAGLAATLAERLADRLGGREVWCGELGAVLGAHVGPGMIAVCVAPRD